MLKQQLAEAMSVPGFENWRPKVDVPELNRPFSRPSELDGSGRIAAIMIMVYPHDDGSRLVLTKRHANLSKHASQISFPGGRQDAGETLEQTALRETEEEIGIVASEIEVLGQLNSVYIPPSDFTVTPFVGWHAGVPIFQRSEEEVDQIIEVPIATLTDPATLVHGNIVRSSGETHRIPYYAVRDHQMEHKVWGATAIMLGEFIELLRRTFSDDR